MFVVFSRDDSFVYFIPIHKFALILRYVRQRWSNSQLSRALAFEVYSSVPPPPLEKSRCYPCPCQLLPWLPTCHTWLFVAHGSWLALCFFRDATEYEIQLERLGKLIVDLAHFNASKLHFVSFIALNFMQKYGTLRDWHLTIKFFLKG